MANPADLLATLTKVTPSIEGLKANILRQGIPHRVHFFDLGIADTVKEDVFAHLQSSQSLDTTLHPWQREILIHSFLGYDVFRIWLPNAGRFQTAATEGTWSHNYGGVIRSWEDFSQYPWPRIRDIDFRPLEWYEKNLPPNMGVTHTIHVWEVVSALFGFERFCLYLYDEPQLVDAVFAKIGEYYSEFARQLADFRCVFCLLATDDLGFKASTLLPPTVIRQKILPWHKRWSQIAHTAGKLYFLHSCGKIDVLMDDLIDDVKIDAKHSFEDVIEPVTVAKHKYGNRIALLGGLDVDFLARSNEEAIREKVREVLAVCMPNGGYCLGSGNWITSYIPLANYLVTLDEARRWTTT